MTKAIKEIKALIENTRKSQDIVIKIENSIKKLKPRLKTTEAFLHANVQ